MPESVTDRPTSATEKLFLFAKSPRYFYDAEAVRVPGKEWNGQAGTFGRNGGKATELEIPGQASVSHRERDDRVPTGRNLWNYWVLGPEPFSGSHYAVFPTALVEPCIKAGSSEKGCCPKCGSPWVRVTDHEARPANEERIAALMAKGVRSRQSANLYTQHRPNMYNTIGWQPACTCPPHDPVPCVILDPFAGSGTSLLVARQLGRHAVGLDLSYAYLHDQARSRLSLDALDEWQNGRQADLSESSLDSLPLFTNIR